MSPDGSIVPFVLAAGFGNRLRPLTDVLPKPAVPLMGQPMVGHALARLARAGCSRAVVNAHHLDEVLVERVTAWRDRFQPDMQLDYSVEQPEILGTGGGLVAARSLLGSSSVVVVNGDILMDFDLPALLADHRRSGAAATLLIAEHPDVEKFGAIVTDGEGRVLDLAGLASRSVDAAGGVAGAEQGRGVFAGVYIVEPEVFEFLPPSGFACVVRQGHVPMMKAGLDVRAVIHRGTWNDLGTLERYLQTHADLLDHGFPGGVAGAQVETAGIAYGLDAFGVEYGDRAAVDLHGRAVLQPPVALGAGCRVDAGVVLGPHAVVGEGARVGEGAAVSRAVVWPAVSVAPGARIVEAVCYRDGGGDEAAT